jgi:hypothetical protein
MKAESLYIQKLTYDENTGNEIIGLFPSEANPAIVSSYTYDAKRMGGAPTLTATIYSSEPLQWKKEEFVEYNGDRFFASYTPNSTKDNSSRMWKNEITFTSRRELLDNTLFFDVVVDDVDTQNKDRYRSNQTKFTFGGTIHEFVARVNSSMTYCGLYRPTDEYKGYYVVVDEGYGTDEVKEVSFEDQYLTDVLQLINTTFELDYYWDGNVCHVGKVQHDLTDIPIKYGSSDALISVSKENANYKIVDMITGYGSSDNLPYYYPNDDEFGEAIFDAKNIASEHVDVTLSDYLRYSKYNDNLVLFKSKKGKYEGNVDVSTLYVRDTYSPENLTQADNSQNPKVKCWFWVSIKINVKKGQIIDFSKISFNFELFDYIQKKENITNLSSATRTINIYTTYHDLYKNVCTDSNLGDACSVEFAEDGTFYIDIDAIFSYNCKVFTMDGKRTFHGSSAWKVSFSGDVVFSLDTNSEYSWKNGDNYIPLDNSGIYVNGIASAKYVEYDYNFRKNDEGIYGFDKIYTGTEDDAVQVSVTGRKWIAPSSVLMPSIYRNTKGAERFYYALNNTHKLPSGSGYYEFVNLYKKGNPHQGTVTFGDIKPTIKGIVNAEGQLFGEIADIAFDSADSDVKDSDGKYIHSYFYIKLHKFNGDFGFDLFAHALASEPAKINLIKSNGCPACSFVIYNQPSTDNSKCYNCVSVDENGNLKPVRTDKNDYIFANASDAYEDKLNQDSTQKELWIAVQKDTSTLGIIMPNASAGFKPQKGDLFVITGIKPPKVLVTAAEKRLDDALIKHMSENNTDQFNYSVKFSRIFLQENPDFASKLNENAKLSIQIQGDSDSDGNLISHEVFVSNYSVKVDNDELAEVEIELVNSLEVTKSDTKQIIDAVKGETVKSLSSMVGGSNTNSFNASITDKMYLSKLKDDTAKGTVTWEKVQKFLQGLLVGGGSWTPDAEGRSHLITDYLEVRMKAIFEELVINKTSTIGGKEIISPAGGVVAHKVEEVTVTYNNVSQKAYRCYFLAEQDGDEVDNDFAVNDQVRSESFNVRKGTYHKAGNHFYWRLVIGRDEDPVELEGKKYHYIDLSDTDCATASDVPAKGDVLNQCGNRTDVERQNCLIFSAVDTYSPSISLYHGINSYSFANREYVEYGVNKQNNKAFFHVYGDMYFGDRPTSANNYEGDSYVKYDSDKKKVTIKGDLDIKSTYDGKTLDKYITEKSLDKNAVETIIKKSETITDLQNQIDGAIETWFYDGVPTLKTEPASGWDTDMMKNHLGDLYYDNKTGKAYRFAKDGSTYKWIIITDTELTKAIEDSSQALKDAKSKRRIFGSQPVPPYDVNDMWVNATYPSDGSTYKNEILKCSTSKAEGEEFDIADWKLASKYTDDTKAEEAKKAAEKAQAEIKNTQTNLIALGTTVSNNKKAFDVFTSDGYLDSSEIAAIAQDSKRLEDDYNAAVESYNNVVGSKFLLDKDGKETTYKTDLVSAKATLDSAKNELITYLSDIVSRYNASDSNGKATIKAAAAQKYTNFTNAYKAFYDKLGVANNYITSNLFDGLNTKLITNMAGLEYIKAALVDGDTVVKGGLILSTLIALRNDKGNVTAGINGADTKENGIALWLGGKAIDKQASTTTEEEKKIAAKSILRFDGTGYFANGNLWWDADGTLHADPTSFIINKNNVGVQLALFAPVWKSGTTDTTKLANVLSIDPQKPFTHLDVSGNVTTEGSLKIGGIYLSYDSANNALRLSKDAAGKEAANFYTTGGITAYGAGASTTGGGGLIASVISYARILEGSYTDADLTSIPNAYAIKALSSRIDNIATELGGLNLSWNNITGKPSTFTPSAHTHKWTEITDRITKVSQLTNDKGYLTAHQSLASYYTKAEIDAKGYTTNKGTVTSVALTLPTGLTCATKTITTSGTFAISLASGYSIPTTAKQTAWDGAVSAKHTHSNKSVLDGITSTKVTCWDSAYDWYALITTDEETADGVINKWNEVVSFLANIAQTDTLSGIVDGINKSISDEVTRAKKAEGVNASGISTNKTSITTLQGYFTSGSAKKALQLTNTHKLWGNSFNGTADINGSIIVPDGKYISIGNIKMEYDATNKALKITNTTTNEVANLYTSGGVSAYGVGTSSSSGGGLNGSVKSYSNALKLTSESLSEIASAYSIKALDSRISSLEGGSATAISVSGSGNAVTSVTKDGTTISVVKGSTFLTSHQSLDGYVNAISVSGSGNAITSVSKSGKGITFTKGATFLTSHQSLANYYTKSSVDSLLSGKSATSHTHSVKINGVTKTIAATGGTAVDLGTYLTSHQSLANYVTINDSRLSDSRYPKFANNTWYLVGDDAYIGDHNIGGTFCIKSANNVNVSGIAIYNSDETKVAKLWFDNTNINLDKQLVMNNKRIWIQGVGTAGGNNNRLTLVAGMPSGLVYNTSCRGTILYSNGIAFADPYNGNSNNDSGWIRHLETSGNRGTLEIAVGDDNSNEEIHFRWYNTNTSAETIGNDITVPRATGTLALTSQIPTTLPANGGNSDTVDGYHANGLLTAISNSDKGISITVGGTTKSVSNISVNYASSAGNADTVDGVHVNQLCRIYTFNVHNHIIKVGTLTSGQYGHVCKLRFNSGIGYNASNQDKAMTVVIRASNGKANSNGFYFEAHSESYRAGAFTTFYLHQTSKTQCELYMAAFDYSGQSTYEISFSAGDLWTNEMSVQSALPTSNIFTLPNYQIAYNDYNVASATKLQTARSIWGQSFDGTGNVDGTLTITNSGSDDPHIISTVSKWFHIVSKYKLVLYAGEYNSSQNDAINILSNHNVGIGVDPSYKLHVKGDIYSSSTIRTAAQNKAIMLTNDASPAWISALEGQVIFNTGNAIRFGETAWDWNEWAGLKYTHSNKTIYLGIADKSVFTANSAQSNGTLRLAGITTITPDSGARIGGSGGDLFLGNNNNSDWVKVQDMCSQQNSNLWRIYQAGAAMFNTLTINSGSTFNGAVKVNNMLTAKGIMFTTADVNAFGTDINNWDGSIGANVTNMFNGIEHNNISLEYSANGGSSWTTYTANPNSLFNLINDNSDTENFYLGNNEMSGSSDADKLTQIKKNQLRVTIKIPPEVYQELSWISVDVDNGVDVKCQVYFGNSSGVYTEYVSKVIKGWSHRCDICVGPSNVNVGNDTYRYVRLVFSHLSSHTSLRNGIVSRIRALALTKYNNGSERYNISTTGHIYNYDYNMNTYFPNSILAKGGVTAYQSSDIRLKQDLRKLDYLGIIKAMGGTYGFAWKKDNTRSIGWIAQHVLCNPHLKDIVETDEKGYYKINYWSPKLIATAFGAIEQVGDEVSRLKARVVFLESEVLRLSGDKEDCNKKRLDNKNINLLN